MATVYFLWGDYRQENTFSFDSRKLSVYGGFAGYEESPEERKLNDMDKNGIVEPWEFENQTRFVGGRFSDVPGSFTVLRISGENESDLILDGISIEQGLQNSNGQPAALRMDGKSVLRNSIVRNNRIYNPNGETNVTAPAGVLVNSTDAVVESCLIENNEAQATQFGPNPGRASQSRAAGIYVNNGGTIAASVVRNNRILYDMIPPYGNMNPVKYNPYLFGSGVFLNGTNASAINCVVANNEIRVINWDTSTGQMPNQPVARGAGIAGENGGNIINCTVVNNTASIFDTEGIRVDGAVNIGQGAGIFLGNSNSETGFNGTLLNTVVWGNFSASSNQNEQQIRLQVNSTVGNPQPFMNYINCLTPANINVTNTAKSVFLMENSLSDLAVVNEGKPESALFIKPSVFAGAVWGGTESSSDSVRIINEANWNISDGSYLIGKGTNRSDTPSLDINGNKRSEYPSAGAYENENGLSVTVCGIEGFRRAYRMADYVMNLEKGDVISVFDLCGRLLSREKVVSDSMPLLHTGFVVINILKPSGEKIQHQVEVFFTGCNPDLIPYGLQLFYPLKYD